MSSTLSPTDRWRRFWYLQSVALWLDPMPGRRRRAVVRELRSNLDSAAADVGLAAALGDLGSPRGLARKYLDTEPTGRPRWNQGALAAGLVFGAWLYATMFYAVGMLDALDSTGTTVPARGSFLGTGVEAVFSDAQISAAFSGVPWLPLVVMLLAFLLVGRAWKALPGRRRLPSPPLDPPQLAVHPDGPTAAVQVL